MPRPTGVVEAAAKLDGKQWEQQLATLQGKTAAFVADTRGMGLAAAGGFAAAGVSLGALTLGLKQSGDEALKLRQTLSGAFSGGELDQVAAKISEISALELKGLDQDELIEGGKRLGTFSDQVSKDLERVANVSAKTGETFGTLKDSFAEFTVNPAAQDNLREIADITPEKLVAFGAVLDATGERILTTGQYADSAMTALRGVVDAEYAGAAAKMASNTDKLNASLKLLSQDLGVSVAQASNSAAGALLPFVDGLRALPTEVKATVGVAAGLGSFLSGAAATSITAGVAITDLAANVKNLGGAGKIVAGFSGSLATLGGYAVSAAPAVTLLTGAATGLKTSAETSAAAVSAVEQAVVGFTTGAAPATQATITLGQAARAAATSILLMVGPYLAVVAAAGALYAVGNKLIKQSADQARADRDALQAKKEYVKTQQTLVDVQGKTGEQLYNEGKTLEQLKLAYDDLVTKRDAARKAGLDETAAAIEQRLEELDLAKETVARLEERDRENFRKSGSTALAKDYDEASNLIDLQLAQEKIGVEQSIALKKKAARELIADEKEQRAKLLELDTQAAQLASEARRQTADEEAAEREASNQEGFAAEMDRIKLLQTQRKISQEQAFDLEEQALDRFRRSEDEKRDLTQRRAEQIAADQIAWEKKVEDARKDKLDRELARITLLRTEGKISADQERQLLFEILSTFKLTEDERTKIVQKRASIAKTERDKEAAAAQKASEEEDKRAKEDADRDRKREAKNAEDLADAQARGRDLQVSGLGDRVDRLQGQTEATGKDNTFAIKEALQERLRLEQQSILAEAAKAAAATDSAEARKQIERNAQEEIRQEILSTAEEYEEAMRRQAEALEGFKKQQRGESSFGVGYGIEEFADRLKAEQSTTVRGFGDGGGAQPVSAATLSALSSALERGPTDFNPMAALGRFKAGLADKPEISGTIGVKISYSNKGGLPDADVSLLGFEGFMTQISAEGRGMKSGPKA